VNCECGKVRYLSRAAAKRGARRLNSVGKRRGKVRAYLCDGGFWHLTSESTANTTLRRNDRARMSAIGDGRGTLC
jgi:hypothetical protein